jgi:hypothetical protein
MYREANLLAEFHAAPGQSLSRKVVRPFASLILFVLVATSACDSPAPAPGPLGYGDYDDRHICDRSVKRIKLSFWALDAARTKNDENYREARSVLRSLARPLDAQAEMLAPALGFPKCPNIAQPRPGELTLVLFTLQDRVKLFSWHHASGKDLVCLSGGRDGSAISPELLHSTEVGTLPSFPASNRSINWNRNKLKRIAALLGAAIDGSCKVGPWLPFANNVAPENRVRVYPE